MTVLVATLDPRAAIAVIAVSVVALIVGTIRELTSRKDH